jgi:hypothetical protein
MIESLRICLKFSSGSRQIRKPTGTNDWAYLLLQGIAPQAREGNSDAKDGASDERDLERAVAGSLG